MPIARFQMEDGRIARFEVPEGTTPEQAQTMMQTHFDTRKPSSGSSMEDNFKKLAAARSPELDAKLARESASGKSDTNSILSNVGNMASGLVRGAGSIGSTLVLPADLINDKLAGKELSLDSNRDRRAYIDEFLRGKLGADTSSNNYKLGKATSEIAGTAGMGGAIGNAAKYIAPELAASSPALMNAIKSGGFSTVANVAKNAPMLARAADLGTRASISAFTGGASAALINPEDVKTGMIVGGAVPLVGAAVKSGASLAGKVLSNAIGELGTHTGAKSINDAFNAGRNKSTALVDNMRGNATMADALDIAKDNLQKMGQAKSLEYRNGMAAISGDKSVLDFAGIDNALASAKSIGSYKGQTTNEIAQGKLADVENIIDKWKSLNPAEYHTPEGLDALKKSVGGVLESIPFEQKTARTAVGGVYNSIKSEINGQAPTYAKVMKGYEEASDQIKEIQRTLSLGDKASADTALRKLQSLTRNNANTNYGNRLDLANQLQDQGGSEFLPALSGQALSSFAPRGLGKLTASATAAGSLVNPSFAALLPFQSPRLMGEMAYGSGKLYGLLDTEAAQKAGQLGYQVAPSLLSGEINNRFRNKK